MLNTCLIIRVHFNANGLLKNIKSFSQSKTAQTEKFFNGLLKEVNENATSFMIDKEESMRNNILVMILCLLSAGCTSPYYVRGLEPSLQKASDIQKVATEKMVQRDLEARCIEQFDDFNIGIIEISDDGKVNPHQKQKVFSLIRQKAEDKDKELVILLFVHGWHHSALVCDDNLACFRKVLAGLKASDVLQDKEVVGVYVGWRGESVDTEGFNIFTIWNRKSDAEKIGNTGARELLLELDGLYDSLKTAKNGKRNERIAMFSFGHSLGGAMLLSAARAKMVGAVRDETFIRTEKSYAEQKQNGSSIKPLRSSFGDLVVLLNPAIEARAWEEFDHDLRKPGAYEDDQLPTLIAIASTEDRAVGTALPASRWIRTIPMPWKLFTESAMDREGVGHYDKHITHFLTCKNSTPSVKKETECDCPYQTPSYTFDTYDYKIRDVAAWASLRLVTDSKDNPITCDLKANPKLDFIWGDNFPYMVIQADRSVIGNHNDIYNPALVTFLASFIEDMLLDKEKRMEKAETK